MPLASIIERYRENAVRDLGPKRIVVAEFGQSLSRRLSFFGKGTAGSDRSRKRVVTLTDEVRQLDSVAAPIDIYQNKQSFRDGGFTPREHVKAATSPCRRSVSSGIERLSRES